MPYISDDMVVALERAKARLVQKLSEFGLDVNVDMTYEEISNSLDRYDENALVNKILNRTIGNYRNDTINVLGGFAFAYTKASKIMLQNVTHISGSAFYSCSALTEIYIPNAVSIGAQAFYLCSSLTKIIMPKAVSIDNLVFYGCTLLKSIISPRLARDNVWQDSNNFYIAPIEFFDLGYIGKISYSSLNKTTLKTIVLRTNAVVPLSTVSNLNNTFFYKGEGMLYVPRAQIENYKAATNWSSLINTTTFLSIEGSRYEGLDWWKLYDSKCTLDGFYMEVRSDETVAMFKHTENVEHIYENGVELTDDSILIKDKTLTTEP